VSRWVANRWVANRWVASRSRTFVVSLALGAASLGWARDAGAFCRSRSCDEDATWPFLAQTPCIEDDDGCFIYGPKLHWPTNCLSFSMQLDGSAKSAIDLETARAVVEAAFETWRGADCGGGVTPSFSIVSTGDVECRLPEYNQHQPNANIVMFRDDAWPHDAVLNPIGLTTVTYEVATGKIVDADIELNTFQFHFTLVDDPSAQADLAGVVTHEIGHFLGLSHARVASATMFETALPNQLDMRTLEPDDVAGVCDIYPPGEALSASCPVRHGFSESCGDPEKEDEQEETGCALGGRGNATDLAAAFGLLAIAAVLRRRRAPAR